MFSWFLGKHEATLQYSCDILSQFCNDIRMLESVIPDHQDANFRKIYPHGRKLDKI